MLLYTALDARVRPWVKKTVQLYHCPSRQIQEKADSLGYKPTLYIPLGIDPEFIHAIPATHDGPPTILYVGGLTEQKGLLYLPDALQRIKQKVPNVRLALCGRGPLEGRLKLEFEERGLTDNVEFKGFVDRAKIVDLYRNAHVFVCPSIWSEQFGLVGPEALTCGVPCVGSRVGGIPEWLHDGEWGYLVPPRDSVALADRMSSLLLDRETRLQFGKKGREYVLATHDPVVYQNRWLEIVQQYTRKPGVLSLQGASES
jgi:glycosyltransferase involved in cell wall biosynthesis